MSSQEGVPTSGRQSSKCLHGRRGEPGGQSRARRHVTMPSGHLVSCTGGEMIMKRRLNAFAAAPGLMQQWLDFGNAIHKSGLDASLMELVKIRASQMNGCAMCLHVHTADAR